LHIPECQFAIRHDFGSFTDYFVILKGIVQLQIPNTEIRGWSMQRYEFMRLVEWKLKIFDPKAKKAF